MARHRNFNSAHVLEEDVVVESVDILRPFEDVFDDAAPPYPQLLLTGDDGPVDVKIDAEHMASFLHSLDDAEVSSLPTTPALSRCFTSPIPPTNIVIQLVGSRGDIQPFIAIGLKLQEDGHRVRIASHPTFQSFVESHGLEFFSIGGDPKELMAFIVQNPGLLPSIETMLNGDVQKRRLGVREVLEGCWRSCIEAGNGMIGAEWKNSKPFVADAIIANPPSFAHLHCAERLGVPVHLMFTMPWSPTQAFAHPLANGATSSIESSTTNRLTYALMEIITWQGIGDLVNSFRKTTLGLERIDSTWAPEMISRLRIPHTYLWSPSLIPRPTDWSSHISVSGFSVLSSSPAPTLPSFLDRFISQPQRPVYISFGSIVLSPPDLHKLLSTILTAISEHHSLSRSANSAPLTVLLHPSWTPLPVDCPLPAPENLSIHTLPSTPLPHPLLFPHCALIIHHGGAGTTAASLRAGTPSLAIPFFGDQFFWGRVVQDAGAGGVLPYRNVSVEKMKQVLGLVAGDGVREKARTLGNKLKTEDGAGAAVESFYAHLRQVGLGREKRSCDILGLEGGRAVFTIKGRAGSIGATAARTLVKQGKAKKEEFELIKQVAYDTSHGPYEPISGAFLALTSTTFNALKGLGGIGLDIARLPEMIDSASSSTFSLRSSKTFSSQSTRSSLASPISSSSSPPSLTSSASSISTASFSHSTSTAEQPFTYTTHPVPASSPASAPSKPLGQRARNGLLLFSSTLLRSPLHVTHALAMGAHNAPRLWGDHSVRPCGKITGFKSGCVEGGREMVLGVAGAVEGILVGPFTATVVGWVGEEQGKLKEGRVRLKGWKGGLVGLGKGLGKGAIGGPIKLLGAMAAPVAFPLKGLDMEISKIVHRKDDVVVEARLDEGRVKLGELAQTGGSGQKEILERVLEGWAAMEEMSESRNKGERKMRKGRTLRRLR